MSQQILSVAPILNGQTSHSLPPSQPSTQPSQPQQQQNGPPSNDLIDFGQPSNSSSVPVSSTGQAQQQHSQSLLDLQDQPEEPGHPVKRVDTYTSDLDEFVDATS